MSLPHAETSSSTTWQQFAVILGPIVIGAILGPALFTLMRRAKKKTEKERPELGSHVAQMEERSIHNLRIELGHVTDLLNAEKARNKKCIATITTQEALLAEATVARAQLATWLDIVEPSLAECADPVPPIPRKVREWIQTL